mmetsp:Transcript_75579/g.214979  ORF Transcript_75579/g.214979 Transcript_75579/m.214979 type:complete len:386 (+) Transcript_75579:2601-3758(+)
MLSFWWKRVMNATSSAADMASSSFFCRLCFSSVVNTVGASSITMPPPLFLESPPGAGRRRTWRDVSLIWRRPVLGLSFASSFIADCMPCSISNRVVSISENTSPSEAPPALGSVNISICFPDSAWPLMAPERPLSLYASPKSLRSISVSFLTWSASKGAHSPGIAHCDTPRCECHQKMGPSASISLRGVWRRISELAKTTTYSSWCFRCLMIPLCHPSTPSFLASTAWPWLSTSGGSGSCTACHPKITSLPRRLRHKCHDLTPLGLPSGYSFGTHAITHGCCLLICSCRISSVFCSFTLTCISRIASTSFPPAISNWDTAYTLHAASLDRIYLSRATWTPRPLWQRAAWPLASSATHSCTSFRSFLAHGMHALNRSAVGSICVLK